MSQCADILHLVFEERWRQDVKYGGAEHDGLHTVEEWRKLIHRHVDREGADPATQRRLFVEVAALAVAAAQAIDRRDPASRFYSREEL